MSEIPKAVTDAINYHVLEGRHCGGFVTAILENNLTVAVTRADPDNAVLLKEIVMYCIYKIPHGSWGSPEKVKEWRKKGGDPDCQIGKI